jgi:hypothetical protein
MEYMEYIDKNLEDKEFQSKNLKLFSEKNQDPDQDPL